MGRHNLKDDPRNLRNKLYPKGVCSSFEKSVFSEKHAPQKNKKKQQTPNDYHQAKTVSAGSYRVIQTARHLGCLRGLIKVPGIKPGGPS